MRHPLRLTLFCLVALTVVASQANAIPINVTPGVGLHLHGHGGGPAWTDTPPGLEIAPGRFQYKGEHEVPGKWKIEWDIDVDPDPYLHAVFVVTNTSPNYQDFTLLSVLPISPAITGGTYTGGSISGALVDLGGGAEMTALLDGTPIYMARIDGIDYHSLMDSPQSITAGAFETQPYGAYTFGAPIPSLLGPDSVLTSIGIDLNLRLSPGDVATVVATFVVEPVPEPSTMVLAGLGLIGLVGRGLRRRRQG